MRHRTIYKYKNNTSIGNEHDYKSNDTEVCQSLYEENIKKNMPSFWEFKEDKDLPVEIRYLYTGTALDENNEVIIAEPDIPIKKVVVLKLLLNLHSHDY